MGKINKLVLLKIKIVYNKKNKCSLFNELSTKHCSLSPYKIELWPVDLEQRKYLYPSTQIVIYLHGL